MDKWNTRRTPFVLFSSQFIRSFLTHSNTEFDVYRLEASDRPFEDIIMSVGKNIAEEKLKRRRLKELDLIVVDNSLRESTVGQLRGHTLENKWKIYNEVKKCGFKLIIVAAFSHMTRVDDTFIKQIVARGEDLTNLFAFTEIIESVKDGIPDTKSTPVGLVKMKALGLINPIIEIDLAINSINWDVFTVQDMCQLLRAKMEWSRKWLSPDTKIMVNLRDFPDAMIYQMERLFTVVDFLGSLPASKRPFAIIYEEPTGKYLPEEVGAWTAGMLTNHAFVSDIFGQFVRKCAKHEW